MEDENGNIAGATPPRTANIDHEDLHVACRLGDLMRVRYLVEILRRDVNAPDAHDSTPLYYAALCGHADVCRYLLENGAKCSEDASDKARIYYAALTDELRTMLREYHLSRAAVNPFYELLRRAFDDREFADVEVEIGANGSRRVVKMHTAMLCVRCPVLAELVSRGRRTDEESGRTGSRINMPLPRPLNDNTQDAALRVLEYLYTGRFETQSVEVATEVVRVSRVLGIVELFRDLRDTVAQCEESGDDDSRRAKSVLVEHDNQLRMDMATLARCIVVPDGHVLSPRHDTLGSELRPQLHPALCDLVRSSSDASLRSETGEIHAVHRFVVCGHSDYFRGAFLGSFAEAEEGSVTLFGLSSNAIAATCEWMYSDRWEVSPSPELCVELLDVSSRLLMPRMAALAGTVLAPHVDEGNVLPLLGLSRLHQLQRLEDSCVRVLALRIEEVVNSEGGREGLRLLIREEASETTQKGNVNVTDLPLVADLRKVLMDYYEYLDGFDDDEEEENALNEDAQDANKVKWRPFMDGGSIELHGRSLRQERTDKLTLLDRMVEDALSV